MTDSVNDATFELTRGILGSLLPLDLLDLVVSLPTAR
jgi:hypothetical protein